MFSILIFCNCYSKAGGIRWSPFSGVRSFKLFKAAFTELLYFNGESLGLSILPLTLALSGEVEERWAELFLELRSGDMLSGSREALLSCVLRSLIS